MYWAAQGIFVAHCAGATLTSADGATWTNTPNLFTSSNEVLAVSGEQLISAQTNAITATNTIAEKPAAANTHGLDKSSYPKAVAAKPADADGNIDVLMRNQNILYDVRLNVKDGTYTWSADNKKNNDTIPNAPYDMVYAKAADQFISVNDAGTLYVVNGSGGTDGSFRSCCADYGI